MRTAIALIGLGVAGGTIPAGVAGIAHAGTVVGGAAAALALLVGVCLAAPVLARRKFGATEPKATKPGPFRPVVRSPARGI
jgi:hypothetical protein